MKRILVCFDGSEGAEKALNKAITLMDDDGELLLLAVVPTPSDQTLVDTTVYDTLKIKAHNLIQQVIDDIGIHDFDIRGIVEEGDIAAKIIDVANREKCELIMLGSKGSSALGQYPIGSVANKVVQYAHKPVMVVR
jgi:nucleotide-binding universal stress UspA family protein